MKNYKQKSSRSLRSSFSELDKSIPLESLIYNTAEEWYKTKHPSVSFDEINYINSLSVDKCPYYHSSLIKKNGKTNNGMQRFMCLRCGRRFNPLTGTLFDSRKIPISEWIEFLIHLFQYESLLVSSLDNRNVQSTGRYWTKKVFEVLNHYQDDIVLDNTFWIDETYLKVKPSDMTLDHKRRKLRGLSHDKICIATATDGINSILYVVGYGKPSSNKIKEAMQNHIKPESKMIEDKEKSHQILVDLYQLKREIHSSKEAKNLDDKNNPMRPINELHMFFKKFISHQGSYDRNELQCWCNLFSFMYNHQGDVAEMVKDYLSLAISTKKVMRYRDVMKKKL